MYFALFYLLFFVLDILAFNKFTALGMIPMHAFVAGVGCFCWVFLLRRRRAFKKPFVLNFGYFLFLSNQLLFTLNEFIRAICRFLSQLLQKPELVFTLGLPDWMLWTGALITSVYFIIIMPRQQPVIRWMLYASLWSLLPLIWDLVRCWASGKPGLLLWWYSGIGDLPMLFCWLMIVYTVLDEEVQRETRYCFHSPVH